MPHSRPRRLLAATLITSMLATAGPASAAAVLVLPNGTFWPKYVDIPNGGSVTWYGLTRKDGIARIAAAASSQAVAGTVDRDDVCGTRDLADPGYANPYQQAFDGTDLDPTGPDRFGHSGIWALGTRGRLGVDDRDPKPRGLRHRSRHRDPPWPTARSPTATGWRPR
jgi:hypothetical protein